MSCNWFELIIMIRYEHKCTNFHQFYCLFEVEILPKLDSIHSYSIFPIELIDNYIFLLRIGQCFAEFIVYLINYWYIFTVILVRKPREIHHWTYQFPSALHIFCANFICLSWNKNICIANELNWFTWWDICLNILINFTVIF